ncbi:MAG: molybdopterin molybdotransferase MoeA [Candidatus Bathyarchaeia archaeon]
MRLKGFQKLTSVDEALQTFFNTVQIRKPKTVIISLDLALNRVLAEDVVAEEDLPRFDRSTVDGYAVKAKDTFGASQFKPKVFRVTDEREVDEGKAKQVWTGNPIPKGADAVVMLENTKRIDGDKIEVWTPVTPAENVSRKGEDVAKGEIAVKAGTRLKPQHLGLIAALGFSKVKVFELPKVALLATGNELVSVGEELGEGQVFEVNRLVLSAMCRELGAELVDLGIAKDNVAEIVSKLKAGFAADVIITTGGTSVGLSDLVPEAVNKLGKPGVIVHGVAMRPAMPTALAVVSGKPIIILSGNPVAAMIGFEVFARPLISRMLGMKRQELRPVVTARVTRKVAMTLGRKTFVRVRVFQKNGEFFAEPVSAKGSGMISTVAKANGYVIVPENREGLTEGETVTVYLFGYVEMGEADV